MAHEMQREVRRRAVIGPDVFRQVCVQACSATSLLLLLWCSAPLLRPVQLQGLGERHSRLVSVHREQRERRLPGGQV